ncbi:unnamed protein product [Rotaria magnacalcarata]
MRQDNRVQLICIFCKYVSLIFIIRFYSIYSVKNFIVIYFILTLLYYNITPPWGPQSSDLCAGRKSG